MEYTVVSERTHRYTRNKENELIATAESSLLTSFLEMPKARCFAASYPHVLTFWCTLIFCNAGLAV